MDFSIIYAIMASQSGETAGDRRVGKAKTYLVLVALETFFPFFLTYFLKGYIACTLFLEKDHELGIMLINTLQRDLKSQNYLDQCAALNAICYLEHTEMVDSVLDLVIHAMEFPK